MCTVEAVMEVAIGEVVIDEELLLVHLPVELIAGEGVGVVGPKPGDVGPTGRKPFYTPKASS